MWRPIITAAYGQQDVPNMGGDTTSGDDNANKGPKIDDVD